MDRHLALYYVTLLSQNSSLTQNQTLQKIIIQQHEQFACVVQETFLFQHI